MFSKDFLKLNYKFAISPYNYRRRRKIIFFAKWPLRPHVDGGQVEPVLVAN